MLGKRQGPNGESICFSADGDSYFTVSEGKKQAIYRVRLAGGGSPRELLSCTRTGREIARPLIRLVDEIRGLLVPAKCQLVELFVADNHGNAFVNS